MKGTYEIIHLEIILLSSSMIFIKIKIKPNLIRIPEELSQDILIPLNH